MRAESECGLGANRQTFYPRLAGKPDGTGLRSLARSLGVADSARQCLFWETYSTRPPTHDFRFSGPHAHFPADGASPGPAAPIRRACAPVLGGRRARTVPPETPFPEQVTPNAPAVRAGCESCACVGQTLRAGLATQGYKLKWAANNEPLPFIYESTGVITR